MKCSKCGEVVQADASFCMYCGTATSISSDIHVPKVLKKTKPLTPKPVSANKSSSGRKSKKPTPDVDRSGKWIFAAIIVAPVILLLVNDLSSGSSWSFQNSSAVKVQTESSTKTSYTPDYSHMTDAEICERYPQEAKKLLVDCTEYSTEESSESSQESASSSTEGASETGYELMMTSLYWLNREDPNGGWFEDPYIDASGFSVGTLLDDYSVYPAGCAAKWYDNDSDREAALNAGRDNFFSDFYNWWVYDSGPVVLVIANSPTDPCYQNIRSILQLSD